MKCPKCNAENINEAVKCGICGARLKHTKQSNIFTDSANVEASVRRENKKAPHQSKPIPQSKPATLTETLMDKNVSVEDKARIFLDSWQDKVKDTSNDTRSPAKKKNLKIVWILLAIFMFGPAVLGVVASVVIPVVISVIGGGVHNDNVATDEAEPAISEDVISNEYQARYYDLQGYQERLAQYYNANHRFAKSLKDIEKYEQTQFSDFIFDQIEITQEGVLVGKFTDSPTSKIYMVPQVEHNQIHDWQCYRVNISDDLLHDCKLLSTAPDKFF